MTSRCPTWAKSYERALLELDNVKLVERTAVAEAAITARLFEIRNDSDHHEERRSIENATRNLTLLRRLNPQDALQLKPPISGRLRLFEYVLTRRHPASTIRSKWKRF
jgi:hypothetical protein